MKIGSLDQVRATLGARSRHHQIKKYSENPCPPVAENVLKGEKPVISFFLPPWLNSMEISQIGKLKNQRRCYI